MSAVDVEAAGVSKILFRACFLAKSGIRPFRDSSRRGRLNKLVTARLLSRSEAASIHVYPLRKGNDPADRLRVSLVQTAALYSLANAVFGLSPRCRS